MMNKPTLLELTLLRIIHRGNGQANWYQLETGLSRMDVPRVPGMMTVLNEMVARGIVTRRVTPGSPFDKWQLTEDGLALLEAAETDFVEVIVHNESEKLIVDRGVAS